MRERGRPGGFVERAQHVRPGPAQQAGRAPRGSRAPASVPRLAGAYTLGLDRWFMAAVPEELRGRAMTLLTAGLMTVQGVGMALAGVAAEFFPVHRSPRGSVPSAPDACSSCSGRCGGPKGETGLTAI